MQHKIDDSIVGKDLEARCSKCGESWHVIVAVSDGKIAEVECKSCGGRHKYRPIHKDRLTVKKNTATSVALSTTSREALIPEKKSKASAEKHAAKTRIEQVPVPLVEHNGGETKDYMISRSDYILGDRIMHKKFGEGIVDGILPSQKKMFVTFSTGRTQLVYGK